MSAPYPALNGTLMGNDITYLFVYVNQITNGLAMPLIVLAFFMVVLLGGMFMQLRFSGRIRPETIFAAASFATLGFAIFLIQKTGMFDMVYFIPLVGICILSVLWLIFSKDEF